MEPLRNLQRMEAKQNISFSEHTGNCWNLLGIRSVLGTRPQPNATFPNCNSHGTYWNLLEPLWNLQPAWAKLDFSFSEPTGTCSEYIRFWAPGLSQTQLSRKCNSHGNFENLLELLRNLQPAWAKLDVSFSEPTGTCSEPIRF